MSFLTQLLGGGLTSIADVADKFINTPEEKQKFQLELKKIEMEVVAQAESSYQTELNARADIIKSEMQNGNNYTKNARPTIIYAGLVFISLVHVIAPIIAYFSAIYGNIIKTLPELTLPGEFWWAWGTVVSVYGVGRTAEKFGVKNKAINIITGSK